MVASSYKLGDRDLSIEAGGQRLGAKAILAPRNGHENISESNPLADFLAANVSDEAELTLSHSRSRDGKAE